MPAQLAVKNVSKTYGKPPGALKVLSSVNITVGKAEFVAVIGPNGCGKSTLLKLIAGIEQPTSGKLTSSLRSSYLPQQPSLLPWRTVEQNLALPGDVRRDLPKQDLAATRQLLKDFGLLEFAAFYPRALSGGMQQKVALLRAVISSPALLLLDEPFAALDALTRLELQRWLLDLQQTTRAAVICVTHDIREAVFLADTIYVLSRRPGKVRQRFSVPSSTAGQHALEQKLYELLVPAT
jgi:ABC-type nitrate/sulfonate/bicarbonate transport system ATPase subunit